MESGAFRSLRLHRIGSRTLALFALLAFGAASAFAQAPDQSGFWRDSTRAAAESELGSDVAPLLLGNAFAIAQAREENGVRSLLTRMQALVAYVMLDQYAAFKKAYPAIDSKVLDRAPSDPELKGYIATAALLRGVYYDRWSEPRPGDELLRTPTLESAAPRFANVEIALRKKLAPEDPMDLADALASRGLMLKKRQEYKPATDDYLAALSLFAAARRDNNAIDSVDRAFSLGDGGSGANGALATPDSQSGAEDFAASVDEPYVPITIITAVDGNADQTIGAGDAVAAKSLIDLMGQAEAQSARINQFMLANWPCHIDLAQVHYWDAVIDGARLKYSKKFNPGGGAEQSKYFDEANAEYIRALAISLFSAGRDDGEFGTVSDHYIQFLRDSGRDEEASHVTQIIGALPPGDIGRGEPDSWRKVLDCPLKSM